MSAPSEHANRGGPRDGQSRKRPNPFGNRGRNRRGPPNQQTPNRNHSTTTSTSTPPVPPPKMQAQVSAELPIDGPSFASLSQYHVHSDILTALQDLNLRTMTPVQAQTLPLTLAGDDLLAQAKTGTGKTIAFLLPAIQKLVTSAPAGRPIGPAKFRGVSALVISPTRELAIQIAEDAKRLLSRFPEYKVQIAVGGTNAKSGLNKVVGGCDILIATPGRLLDYLDQPDQQLRTKLQKLQTFVLDEADRLMDMGFLPDIKKIVSYLPDKAATGRQGMLFSATINDRVQQFASIACSTGYKFISTIPKGEAQTHEHVPQRLITVPTFSDLATAVLGAVRQEIAAAQGGAFKAIIFAPTAAQVDFYADVLSSFRDLPKVQAVHSRMSQPKRTKNTDDYRKATSGILVATDVIARGLDFPGVTNVFQVGLPAEKEAYIHRLGRTARAGADGRGTLLIASHESAFPKKSLPMIKFMETPADLSDHGAVMQAVRGLDTDKRDKVYRAWLGFYKACLKTLGWDSAELVRQANTLAREGLGLPELPSLEKKTVGKMGLKGVPGLNIAASTR